MRKVWITLRIADTFFPKNEAERPLCKARFSDDIKRDAVYLLSDSSLRANHEKKVTVRRYPVTEKRDILKKATVVSRDRRITLVNLERWRINHGLSPSTIFYS